MNQQRSDFTRQVSVQRDNLAVYTIVAGIGLILGVLVLGLWYLDILPGLAAICWAAVMAFNAIVLIVTLSIDWLTTRYFKRAQQQDANEPQSVVPAWLYYGVITGQYATGIGMISFALVWAGSVISLLVWIGWQIWRFIRSSTVDNDAVVVIITVIVIYWCIHYLWRTEPKLSQFIHWLGRLLSQLIRR